MDNELGKVGYRIARKLNDNNYGSYEVVAWAEQSYHSLEEKAQVEQLLATNCKAMLFKDVAAIQKKMQTTKG